MEEYRYQLENKNVAFKKKKKCVKTSLLLEIRSFITAKQSTKIASCLVFMEGQGQACCIMGYSD